MCAGPRALCLLKCNDKYILARTPCVSAWNGLLQHNHCQVIHLCDDTIQDTTNLNKNENYIWIYHTNKDEDISDAKFPDTSDLPNSIHLIEQNGVRYLSRSNEKQTSMFFGLLPDNAKEGDDVTNETSNQAIKKWLDVNMITGQDVTKMLSQSRIENWTKNHRGFKKFCELPMFTNIDEQTVRVLYKGQMVDVSLVLTKIYEMTLDQIVLNQCDIADYMAQITVIMTAIELEKFKLPLYDFILGKITNDSNQILIKNKIFEINKTIHRVLKNNSDTLLEDVSKISAEKKALQLQLNNVEKENNCKISKLLTTILSSVSLKGTYTSTQIKARSLKAEQRKAMINSNVEKAKTTKSNEYFENFTQDFGAAIFDINSDTLFSLLRMAKELSYSSNSNNYVQMIMGNNMNTRCLAIPNSRAMIIDETTASCLIELTNVPEKQHNLMTTNGVSIAQSNSSSASSLPIPLLKKFVLIDDPSTEQWHILANDSNNGISTYRILFRGMIASAIISRDLALNPKDLGVGYVVLELLLSCAEKFVIQIMENRIPDNNDTQPCVIMRSLLGHILATMASTNAILCPGYKIIYNEVILSQISPIDFSMMLRLVKLLPYALWDTKVAMKNLTYYLARSIWNAMYVAIQPMIKETTNDKKKKNTSYLVSRQKELELLSVSCSTICRLFELLQKNILSQTIMIPSTNLGSDSATTILLNNDFPNSNLTQEMGKRFMNLFENTEFINETTTTKRIRQFAIDLSNGKVSGPQFQDIMYRAISCTFKRSAMFKNYKQTLCDAMIQGTEEKYIEFLNNLNIFYSDQVQKIENVCGLHYNVQKKSKKGYDPKPQNICAFQTKSESIQHDAEKNKGKIWALDNFDDVDVDSIRVKVNYIISGNHDSENNLENKNESIQNNKIIAMDNLIVEKNKVLMHIQKICLKLKDVSGNGYVMKMIMESDENLCSIVSKSLGTTKDIQKNVVNCDPSDILMLTDLLQIPRNEVNSLVKECVLITFENWRTNETAITKMVELIKEKQMPKILSIKI